MTLSVSIYGFGSAFAGKTGARDIDLLIVHPSIDPASCRLSIACKRGLSERVPLAHVTMLSATEEGYFKFIDTANALLLGTMRNDHFEEDLDDVLAMINELIVDLANISATDQ